MLTVLDCPLLRWVAAFLFVLVASLGATAAGAPYAPRTVPNKLWWPIPGIGIIVVGCLWILLFTVLVAQRLWSHLR